MFAFILVLLFAQIITDAEAGGEKGDTIIIGGHCGPKFVLKEGKKGKGATIVMNHGDCHKKEESHYGYH
ncbi:hypothetical protein RDWZM_007106 [Blomia tropicalis]|uniref:Uncharacterized protein n=1 Tax=Blomia tropicalis TaxID=40697 RepID=A0A9Q0M9C3_BLOTA|nr:hypothetical protein RDWZM_007106 [Blomia tropicalis]